MLVELLLLVVEVLAAVVVVGGATPPIAPIALKHTRNYTKLNIMAKGFIRYKILLTMQSKCVYACLCVSVYTSVCILCAGNLYGVGGKVCKAPHYLYRVINIGAYPSPPNSPGADCWSCAIPCCTCIMARIASGFVSS